MFSTVQFNLLRHLQHNMEPSFLRHEIFLKIKDASKDTLKHTNTNVYSVHLPTLRPAQHQLRQMVNCLLISFLPLRFSQAHSSSWSPHVRVEPAWIRPVGHGRSRPSCRGSSSLPPSPDSAQGAPGVPSVTERACLARLLLTVEWFHH